MKTIKDFLDYEIRAHWLASWVSFDWGQELLGRYFARKVKRKYNRYLRSKQWVQKIKNHKL